MVPPDVQTIQKLRLDFEEATIKCSERCLYQSAKWAAEQLNSLAAPDAASPTDTEVDSPMSDAENINHAAGPGIFSQNQNYQEARLEAAEAHKYMMAKSFFDCREYDRCAGVFLPMTLPRGELRGSMSSPEPKRAQAPGKGKTVGDVRVLPTRAAESSEALPKLSQKSLFLALYAKYISGEKRKDEESEMILGPADGAATPNKELAGITRFLKEYFQDPNAAENGQGWLEYLYGVCLAKNKATEEAKEWLVASVNRNSYIWDAWLELGSLIATTEELENVAPLVPQDFMGVFFNFDKKEKLHQDGYDVQDQHKRLRQHFPGSSFLKAQKGLFAQHAKDFEKADKVFSKLIARDPHRLESLDGYSNVLFVMEKRSKLAFLAQLTTATDKFRPETCVVVGNYYAMKSEHEKAVMYFRRALTLDRNFTSAWTLMGHEYVEMKNTHAAIECYRRAVDIERSDFRAWYGLGQTYEMLEMFFYALFYYDRAAAVSPTDPKMWGAIGSCLAKMQRPNQALKAFKRALVAGSAYTSPGSSFGAGSSVNGVGLNRPNSSTQLDPDVLYEISCMYHMLGKLEETKAYLELVLAQEEGGGLEDEETALKSSMGAASNAAASGSSQGVGVTKTTCRARLWLAKLEVASGGREGLKRAKELANELCSDGWEVEEAKTLLREVEVRTEDEGGNNEENGI